MGARTAVGDDIVIAGVGETEYTRASGRSTDALAAQAIIAACRDAGIDPRAIDGIVGYPYQTSAEEVISMFDLPDVSFSPTLHMGGASAVASLGAASQAIRTGAATHVLVFRARNGASGARVGTRPSHLASQHLRTQLEHPYGLNTPGQRYAMICRRYMHEHDLTREQLGHVALAMREWAQLNPGAMMYGRPLTMEDYLGGRMIADPYTLFDCSPETDGACAVIVSAADAVVDRDITARVTAVAEGRAAVPDDLTSRDDLLAIGLDKAALRAWEISSLAPSDMDAAMIYDCFTFELLHQLESAGFVPEGDAGAFVERGAIRPGGELPVNTHGGLLSGGHMVGLNHVVEAARQLRGECGRRQVENVQRIAATGWGDLGDGSIAVMERVVVKR
jgi:acetyl-CoA acetyltransferase